MIPQQSVLVLTMRADFKGPTRSVVHIQIYLCWKIFVDLENVINCCIRIKKILSHQLFVTFFMQISSA